MALVKRKAAYPSLRDFEIFSLSLFHDALVISVLFITKSIDKKAIQNFQSDKIFRKQCKKSSEEEVSFS